VRSSSKAVVAISPSEKKIEARGRALSSGKISDRRYDFATRELTGNATRF